MELEREADQSRVWIDSDRYQDLDWGYAITAHRGQGLTADATLISGDPSAWAQLLYTLATRQREEIRFYGVDRLQEVAPRAEVAHPAAATPGAEPTWSQGMRRAFQRWEPATTSLDFQRGDDPEVAGAPGVMQPAAAPCDGRIRGARSSRSRKHAQRSRTSRRRERPRAAPGRHRADPFVPRGPASKTSLEVQISRGGAEAPAGASTRRARRRTSRPRRQPALPRAARNSRGASVASPPAIRPNAWARHRRARW